MPPSVPYEKVYFDLETGGLATGSDITQIAAVCVKDNIQHTFSHYVTSILGISSKASQVTGLTCSGGVLMHHGEPVRTLPIIQALLQFIAWLSDIGSCVLVDYYAPHH